LGRQERECDQEQPWNFALMLQMIDVVLQLRFFLIQAVGQMVIAFVEQGLSNK
jgi:hypothetical protein